MVRAHAGDRGARQRLGGVPQLRRRTGRRHLRPAAARSCPSTRPRRRCAVPRRARHAVPLTRVRRMTDPSPLHAARSAHNPSTGPLLPRLVNAILLRREFYDAVAADPRATGPAGAIVCIAAIARESVGLYQLSQDFKGWGLVLLLIVVFAMLRWLLYATDHVPDRPRHRRPDRSSTSVCCAASASPRRPRCCRCSRSWSTIASFRGCSSASAPGCCSPRSSPCAPPPGTSTRARRRHRRGRLRRLSGARPRRRRRHAHPLPSTAAPPPALTLRGGL